MHRAAFRALGLPHRYDAIRASADELPGVVDRIRTGALDGLNVTVPYKQRVLALVDVLDPSVQKLGAANTLVRRQDGRIAAHNTDAPALAAEIQRLGGASWTDARALVLGSGGAARSAVAALGSLGIGEIVVRARAFADADRARAFAATIPFPVETQVWSASAVSEEQTRILVQATSSGMQGADPGE